MMKLLIIAHELPPIVRPRSIQTGRLLYHLPQDCKMYVVTSHDDTWQKDSEFYSDIHKKFTEIITVQYTASLRMTRMIFRKVPDVFLCWHISAYRRIINTWGRESFDCIITFSFPMSSHLLGIYLKRHFNTRWIAFFSDPWADNPHFGYKGITRQINSYLERKVFKNADTCIFASPEMHNQYTRKYPFITNHATFLEHSYDPDLYGTFSGYNKATDKKNSFPLSSSNNIPEEGRMPLVLRYIGAFYGERTVEPFLIALRRLLDDNTLSEKGLLFEIIGNIARKYTKLYSSLLKKYALDTVVKFKSPVSYRESIRLMQTSDILVLIDAPIDGSVFLPSKLVDYIGSGRPILAITPKNGAAARIIRKVGGWLVEPNDVPKMTEILYDILDNYKGGTLQQFRPSVERSEEYCVSYNIRKFVNILHVE